MSPSRSRAPGHDVGIGGRRPARLGRGALLGLPVALSAATAAAFAAASGTDEAPPSSPRPTGDAAPEARGKAETDDTTAASLHATAMLFVEFDEDRAWVTEVLDAAPAGPRAVSLSADERRFAPPLGADTGGHGGLRVGREPTAAVALVDGAIVLPERLPPEGISAILEYSLPAGGREVSFERRYPIALRELRVSATTATPGVTVRLGAGPPAEATREAPGLWAATARRVEPLAASEPVAVRVAGLPAYETPAWAISLLLAGALSALGGLGLALAGLRR